MYHCEWREAAVEARTGGSAQKDRWYDKHFHQYQPRKHQCYHGKRVSHYMGERYDQGCDPYAEHRKYRCRAGCINFRRQWNNICYFTIVLLSGQSGSDGKTVQSGAGLCGIDWDRDRLGFILWYRYYQPVYGKKSKKSIWH